MSTSRQFHVLVAGGAGFIGSHVCERLLAQGHSVTCLDNMLTGSPRNVARLMDWPAFELVTADVVDTPSLDADLILHLASPASPVQYRAHPIETMLANSAGTHRLLELARECGARFLLASTSEVYGDPLEHPQRETYWGNVNPIGPRACYDEGKRFAEALTFEYIRTHGLNAAIVRIFNTYGPRMDLDDGRVVPAFIGAALRGRPLPLHGDGGQTRSFCYVDDLVTGLLHVALDQAAIGDVYNIGNPHEVTIREFAYRVLRATGAETSLREIARGEGDPERRRPDITRMRERYGWEPRTSLEAGLRQTVEYFRPLVSSAAQEATA